MSQKSDSVKLTHDLLEEYSSARSKWAKQAVEDNEFRYGKQWQDKHVDALKKRAQTPVVVNVVHSAVEQAKAMLTSNAPKFQSTGRDDSDVNTGRIFSDLMTWVWDNSNGDSVLKQVIDDYYVKGMGAMCAYYDPNADYGKGEVFVKAVDPLHLYIDPNSVDPFLQDASHIIVAKKIMRSQLKADYPDYAEIVQEAVPTDYTSAVSTTRHGIYDEQVSGERFMSNGSVANDDDEELELFERFTKIKIPYKRTYDPMMDQEQILKEEDFQKYIEQPAFLILGPQGEQIVTDPRMVEQTQALYDQYDGRFHLTMDQMTGQPIQVKGKETENSIPNSTTDIVPMTIADIIQEGHIKVNDIIVDHIECNVAVGDKEMYSTIKPIEHYPIVAFMNGHNRNPFPISDVRLVKGLQEYINKIRSLIIAHASSSTNVKLLIPRGSMDRKELEEQWGRAGTAVIEYDPELGQPIVAGPVPLPNELYKNEADAKADIERILGIYALMQGDQGSAPQTYKGTVALDEYGQRRIKSKKDDIEFSLNMMAKVIVGLIQAYFTNEKVVRLIQPNSGVPKELRINQNMYSDVTGRFIGRINDVTIGKYDVVVVSGSTLPSNRWARFEYYKELYSMGVIDQTELLKQTDVADMEGVLQRSSQTAQLQGQVQQMNEEVKKLKGDLQTAQRESLHDRKRVELMKYEVKLAKAEAKVEMASSLYKSRASDELSKVKEAVKEVQGDKGTEQTDLNEEMLGLA
tara:strand:- start:2900 stop:5125 length:2226 start_codon:yes stop_codon:yes gene_type:complete